MSEIIHAVSELLGAAQHLGEALGGALFTYIQWWEPFAVAVYWLFLYRVYQATWDPSDPCECLLPMGAIGWMAPSFPLLFIYLAFSCGNATCSPPPLALIFIWASVPATGVTIGLFHLAKFIILGPKK